MKSGSACCDLQLATMKHEEYEEEEEDAGGRAPAQEQLMGFSGAKVLDVQVDAEPAELLFLKVIEPEALPETASDADTWVQCRRYQTQQGLADLDDLLVAWDGVGWFGHISHWGSS
eukprot:s748_g18.t1